MCYHAKVGRSALQGVGINSLQAEPPKLGIPGIPLSRNGGVADHKIYAPPPTASNLIVLRQKDVCVDRREPLKLVSVAATLHCSMGVADHL